MANLAQRALRARKRLFDGEDIEGEDIMLTRLIDDLFFKGTDGQKLSQLQLKKVHSMPRTASTGRNDEQKNFIR
jgi:hypothetical protein